MYGATTKEEKTNRSDRLYLSPALGMRDSRSRRPSRIISEDRSRLGRRLLVSRKRRIVRAKYIPITQCRAERSGLLVRTTPTLERVLIFSRRLGEHVCAILYFRAQNYGILFQVDGYTIDLLLHKSNKLRGKILIETSTVLLLTIICLTINFCY